MLRPTQHAVFMLWLYCKIPGGRITDDTVNCLKMECITAEISNFDCLLHLP